MRLYETCHILSHYKVHIALENVFHPLQPLLYTICKIVRVVVFAAWRICRSQRQAEVTRLEIGPIFVYGYVECHR